MHVIIVRIIIIIIGYCLSYVIANKTNKLSIRLNDLSVGIQPLSFSFEMQNEIKLITNSSNYSLLILFKTEWSILVLWKICYRDTHATISFLPFLPSYMLIVASIFDHFYNNAISNISLIIVTTQKCISVISISNMKMALLTVRCKTNLGLVSSHF